MTTNQEERIKNRKKRKAKFLILLSLFLIILFLIIFAFNAKLFGVKEYIINGISYYSSNEIETMGNFKYGSNIFIGVDYKEIKTRLERDSYIKYVGFERKLPNTVVVNIVERTQLATIVYGMHYLVLDSDGIYLRKTDVNPELTILSGLTINEMTLGKEIGFEETMQFSYVKDILKAMYEHDMFFYKIQVSESNIKPYILPNLVVQGEPNDIINALNNWSLQSVVSNLFDEGIERGTIIISDCNSKDGIVFSPIINWD